MQNVTFSGKPINFEAIVEQFQVAFGVEFISATLNDDQFTVELSDEADLELAESLYDAHDITQLSQRQQLTLVRQAQLNALRISVANQVLTDNEVNSLEDPFKLMSQKIQWLELEFRAFRGDL